MNQRNNYHYLPVDDRAAEWGFYLTTTGHVLSPVATDLPHGVHPDMYMFDLSPALGSEVLKRSSRESGRVLPEFQVVFITDKDHSEALVAQILDLIWTGGHRGVTMDKLCESVGAKRRSMERWFAAARGHSLLTEVNLCRCRRARHFLETTDLPIKKICWLAGFLNPDQMRTNFLHVVGMLPNQYRQRHRRK